MIGVGVTVCNVGVLTFIIMELVDAIVEVTETGSSLKANNLRIVDTLMESTTRFIMNKEASQDKWKRNKVDRLVLMLQGAMAANGRVGLMMLSLIHI